MTASDQLREKVRDAYSDAAGHPEAAHPFPVGRWFAESIGYTPEILAGIPEASIAAFAGVSNPSVTADIQPGDAVLDLGCGAGLDSRIAARRTGPEGRVIGLDFSEAMLARARRSAAPNVEFRLAAAESIPLPDASIDVAIVNGIFNLNPTRDRIFRELARVLRPGGKVYAAELILKDPAPAVQAPQKESDWFA